MQSGGGVLVLNATTEPISVVPVRRAIVLLLKERAEIVEADINRLMRAERVSVPYPLVIRLVTFVRIPYRVVRRPTKRSILRRDGYRCQYCGTSGGPLSVDHVVPESRGGDDSWANCVAACLRCNNRKGNLLPHEAGMKLVSPPGPPKYAAIVWLARLPESVASRYLS
jgi:5-methylcytosine-specific restriction endonuclease McrA